MATCGYICPVCEGKTIKDDGTDCDWCVVKPSKVESKNTQEDIAEWLEKVHQGPCCSDEKC